MDFLATRYLGRVRLLHDVLISALSLLAAFPLASWLRGGLGSPLGLRQQFGLLVVILPIWALVFRLCRSDAPMRAGDRWQQVLVVLKSVTLGVGLLAAFLYLTKLVVVPRSVLVVFYGLNLLLAMGSRLLVLEFLRVIRSHGHNTKRLLIVGTARRAERLVSLLREHPDWGFQVAGLLAHDESDAELVGQHVHGHTVLATRADLLKVLRREVVDEVIFAVPEVELDAVGESLKICEMMGVQGRLMMDFFDLEVARMQMGRVGPVPMLTFRTTPEDTVALTLKGMVDFLGAAILLLLLSPFFLAAALAVRLSSPGPVFFRQKRCGLNGREFVMYKFRSMVDGADELKDSLVEHNEMDGPVFKIRNDPRMTRVGRLLRRTSLDELPQLINVLKGEMSLVGPRPPLRCEVDSYEDWQRRRLSMRPGITGLWQISGRSNLDFRDWIRMDLEYIDRWSLALDLKILAMTIPAVLLGRGAY